MRYLLFLLCLAVPLTAKIRLLSFHFDHPELVSLQEKLLRKFMVDDWELIVFNEAGIVEYEEWIQNECNKLGIQCIYSPLPHLQGVEYAIDHFGSNHDDIVAIMEGDFLPIRPIDLRALLQDVSEIRVDASPWTPFRAFDARKARNGKVKTYLKKNSSKLYSHPRKALSCFGFNDGEIKLVRNLPPTCNIEFHVENRFAYLDNRSDNISAIKAKLNHIESFLTEISIENLNQKADLGQIYEYYSLQVSDIMEHLVILRQLASECPTVIEIGVGYKICSTWGILQGLSENNALHRSYLGIDIRKPEISTLNIAQEEAEKRGIAFRFLQEDDLKIAIEPTDLLFIDSLHTYCHLTYELETFSSQVRKYIALHDTSEPWGDRDDELYEGDYSEYPASYNRRKRGLWPAVEDFLARHPEWRLKQRLLNCHGFTILERVTCN